MEKKSLYREYLKKMDSVNSMMNPKTTHVPDALKVIRSTQQPNNRENQQKQIEKFWASKIKHMKQIEHFNYEVIQVINYVYFDSTNKIKKNFKKLEEIGRKQKKLSNEFIEKVDEFRKKEGDPLENFNSFTKYSNDFVKKETAVNNERTDLFWETLELMNEYVNND